MQKIGNIPTHRFACFCANQEKQKETCKFTFCDLSEGKLGLQVKMSHSHEILVDGAL